MGPVQSGLFWVLCDRDLPFTLEFERSVAVMSDMRLEALDRVGKMMSNKVYSLCCQKKKKKELVTIKKETFANEELAE